MPAISLPSTAGGRREDRVRAAPAVSRAKCASKNAHEHTGSAEAVRPSLRSGLRLTSSSPRRSGFFVTVAGGKVSRRLDASVEASGPHDFAVRISTFRQACFSVHRIPCPTSVTIAKRPSRVGRDGRVYRSDLGIARTEMFLQFGLDSPNHIDPVQEIRLNAHALVRSARSGKSVIRQCTVTVITLSP